MAPKTVAQIKTLARQGFYDGTPFHRVIEGFMAQGGDPTGTGTRRQQAAQPAAGVQPRATSCAASAAWRGRSDPNSANSQFFIMFAPAPAWMASTPSGAG